MQRYLSPISTAITLYVVWAYWDIRLKTADFMWICKSRKKIFFFLIFDFGLLLGAFGAYIFVRVYLTLKIYDII